MVSLNAEHNVKRSVSKIVEEGIPLLNGGDNARMAAHEFGDQFRHHGARGVRSAADPEGAGEFPDKRTQFRRKIVKCRQQNTGAPVDSRNSLPVIQMSRRTGCSVFSSEGSLR